MDKTQIFSSQEKVWMILLNRIMFETIQSVQNNRIKHLVRLRDGSHRRRQQRFLIEGLREVKRALASQWPMETLYFCEELFKDEHAYEILDLFDKGGLEIIKLTEDPFRKCAYRQGPDGLLAVGMQKERSLESLSLSEIPLLVVMEGIEKPGNLGAIFRTANAAGADAIILTECTTDPYNPNVIRASQGAFFELPFFSTTNSDLKEYLTSNGLQPIATSPEGKELLYSANMRGPTALILGTEDDGLSEDWLKELTAYRIPMKGITDSLNVASTAAICLFEAIRQRQD